MKYQSGIVNHRTSITRHRASELGITAAPFAPLGREPPRRSRRMAAGHLALGLCLALGGSSCNAPELVDGSLAVTVDNPAVMLVASRDYGPPDRKHDAEVTLSEPLSIAIPTRIPVTAGNAGNHKARFSFRGSDGAIVECDYRGGSREPHPSDSVELAKASAYVFEHCSDGSAPGKVVQVGWLELQVLVGDQQDPANRTEVRLDLGSSFETLDPPISPADSIAIRDAFSWQRTQAVAETTSDGNPALYYAIVYIEDHEQIEFLDDMLIHHDTLPLFSEELTRWDGLRGIFDNDGDGTGVFVFAMMPGLTYNLIREAALRGDVLFRVVQFREVPVSARAADGTISYAALRDARFRYLDLDAPIALSTQGAAPGPALAVTPKGLFSKLRNVVNAIATAVKAVVRGVQQAIGFVDRVIEGSVTLTTRLNMRNTDPDFGIGTAMLRTWGSRAGTQVNLPGVRVTVRQSVLGFLPTKFADRTDANSVATMKVTKGKSASICLATDSPFAQITSFLIEKEVCDFGSISSTRLNTNLNIDLALQHRLFNILAQATEGGSYLQAVVGLSPRKARIFVGRLASMVAGRNAVTPCFGFPNLAFNAVVDLASEIIGVIGGPIGYTVVQLAGIIGAVDIVVGEDPVLHQDPLRGALRSFDGIADSRGVISHEYGHFALASLLQDQGLLNITIAYTDAIISRITNLDAMQLPPASHEAAYLNEAFADFIGEQISGGKNYVPFGIRSGVGGISYCNGSDSCNCVDRNASDTGTFDDQVARIFSILHDGFDGWPRHMDSPSGFDAWKLVPVNPTKPAGASIFAFNPVGGDAGDEVIQLPGESLKTLIAGWRSRQDVLRQDSFLGGLGDAMYAQGYGWCDACRLFAMHAGATSAASLQPICEQDPVRRWIGARPAGLTCSFDCFDGKPCTDDTPEFSLSCGLSCPHRPEARGVLCRDLAGSCDVAETCDGISTECPADGFASGTVCRPSTAACDPAESCTGASAECPADVSCPAATPPVPTAGLHLWLRADAGVSTDVGTSVARWADQSGNGRNAAMPTLARQPELVQGALNGLPVLRFNGAQSLVLDVFATPTDFTIFIVGKNAKVGPESIILGPAGNSPNNQLRWENDTEALFVGIGNGLPIITTNIGNTRVPHALSVRYDGTTMTVFRDGLGVSSHQFVTTGPWTFASVGAFFSSVFLVGDIGEILIYDRPLSGVDQEAVNSYLRNKYNLP